MSPTSAGSMSDSKSEMRTKGARPTDVHDLAEGHSPFVRLYLEFAQLKQLYRQGWLQVGVPDRQCESVAEHTLGVVLLACLIAERERPDLDRDKVFRMALIHDFGEIHAGDITPRDGVSAAEKKAREIEGIDAVLRDFPGGEEWMAVWHEYEESATPEAQFVKQIDRLEMGLQGHIYRKLGHAGADELFQSAIEAVSDERLAPLLAELEEGEE
ncbi:MAG: HD domain-containing protein [Gemmatimonadetes bacterium]|nr:HD domain-containing protein [Gemmatimonadota bacterium]